MYSARKEIFVVVSNMRTLTIAPDDGISVLRAIFVDAHLNLILDKFLRLLGFLENLFGETQ